MAEVFTLTISADGSTDEFEWKPLRKEMPNRGTLFIFGGGGNNFGGGDVTLQASPDGGTTYINVPGPSGAAINFSSDGMINFEIYGNGDNKLANKVLLKLVTANSTSPTIRAVLMDAR